MSKKEMTIVISVSKSAAFESSNASIQISAVCNYVGTDQGELLLIPQPGKLMRLIKVLKENNIAYRVQDLPSHHRDTL